MKKPILFLMLCLAPALMPALASAATALDESRPLLANAHLTVQNEAGRIEVRGWDRNEVRIRGDLGDRDQSLEITGDNSSLQIRVRHQNSHDISSARLVIEAPAGVRLQLQAVSADVDVADINGPIDSGTVSGDLRLRSASQQLNLSTVSGDLDVDAPSTDTRIDTVSGDVRARGPSGRLRLETVSGDVSLDGGTFERIDMKSVSGDLELKAALTPQAVVNGSTLSANIRLALPEKTSADVSMRSFSGSVRSQFGNIHEASSERDRMQFKVGSGSARIDLSSFSGDVEIESDR